MNEQLKQYIVGAIEDYYAEEYKPNLSVIGDNAYLEFEGLSYTEIKQAVHQVAREVIAK